MLFRRVKVITILLMVFYDVHWMQPQEGSIDRTKEGDKDNG